MGGKRQRAKSEACHCGSREHAVCDEPLPATARPVVGVIVIDGNIELGGALGEMLEIISRIGGFMSAEDQARIRTAREVYAAHGRR